MATSAHTDHSSKPLRVYGVSDVHVDYKENAKWLQDIDTERHQNDALIVAGDVTHDTSLLRQFLKDAKTRYRHVAFTPGNHDLWLNTGDPYADSFEKLHGILAICDEEGVIIRPTLLEDKIWLVPILSWHHSSWDKEPDITGWEGIVPIHCLMADFQRCKWPAGMDALTPSVAEAIDKENDRLSPGFAWRRPGGAGPRAPMVSFSHFLPHQQLCPEKRFLYHPNLPKAVGSDFLKARVERLQSDVHLFGHTHFGWDALVGGTRFIQAPLAYPYERESSGKSLRVGPVAQVECDDAGSKPVLLWQERAGFTAEADVAAYWSDYYGKTQRDPSNTTELASYVASEYTWVGTKPGAAQGEGVC
ncbi:hypothetical protein DIPPA_18074 [Diplonema papillatum]|nr:hypothetical protein DIPPA_18074 [Diplonema papillatum]